LTLLERKLGVTWCSCCSHFYYCCSPALLLPSGAQVASRQMIASYMQRMQRAQSIQRTWNTLRKKDKASLMASLGSDSALAEATLPDTYDSRNLGIVTPPKNQGDCGTWVLNLFIGC
jgi:C1A family cysteine protease